MRATNSTAVTLTNQKAALRKSTLFPFEKFYSLPWSRRIGGGGCCSEEGGSGRLGSKSGSPHCGKAHQRREEVRGGGG